MVFVRWLISFIRPVRLARSVAVNFWEKSFLGYKLDFKVSHWRWVVQYGIDIEQRSSQLWGLLVEGYDWGSKADWSVWSEVGCYQIKMVLVRWLVSFDRSVKIVRSVVVNCRDESRWQTRISESVAEDSLYNIVLKDIEQHSSQLFGLWVDGVHQCDFWNEWNSFFNKEKSKIWILFGFFCRSSFIEMPP